MNNATLRLEQMKVGMMMEEGMRVEEDEECRLAEPSLDNCSLHG